MEDQRPELPEDLTDFSTVELVHLAIEVMDRYAHRGMDRKEIIQILRGEKEPPLEDPLDTWREEIMSFIEENQQFLTLTCHGNCYLHSGAKVTQCRLLLLKGEEYE